MTDEVNQQRACACVCELFGEEQVGVNACCGGPSWKTEETGLWRITSEVKRKVK